MLIPKWVDRRNEDKNSSFNIRIVYCPMLPPKQNELDTQLMGLSAKVIGLIGPKKRRLAHKHKFCLGKMDKYKVGLY